MENIGERLIWHYVPGTSIQIPLGGLNVLTVANTLFVMIVLVVLLRLAVRHFSWIPGRAQVLVETLVGSFEELVSGSMELDPPRKSRHFLPLIMALFMFIILSNSIVLLPIPHIEEPTSDLNSTLGLGLMCVSYSIYSGIKARGLPNYLEGMAGPLWHQEGATGVAALMGRLSALFFFPLHIVEDASRVISISFRLFGNIMGGAIVMTVVGALTYGLVVPIFLNVFLFMFEAAVQAYVFSILTLMYIAGAVRHE